MKLDLMACWNEALGLIMRNREAVLPVAGVFLFLPSTLFAYFVGAPEFGENPTFDEMVAVFTQFMSENSVSFLASNLVISFGSLAVASILVGGGGSLVGQRMTLALKLFPFFLLANILSSVAITLGLFLFIVPGILIAVRLSILPAVVVGDEIRDPIAALQRSWTLTRGNMARILLFLLVIILMGTLILGIIGLTVAIPLALMTENGMPLLKAILDNAAETVFSVIVTAVIVSIYRQLSAA